MDKLALEKITEGSFWEEIWERSNQKQKKKVVNYQENINMWNRRAETFAKDTDNETNEDRRNKVFQFLEDCGLELAAATVLDLGCGPGNYALPMAQQGAQVTALDPAMSMLDLVKEKASLEGIDNISYSKEPWEEVDLDSLGWRGKFDLVFASMSPGVSDIVTLKKMISASKNLCYLSKFAGKRHNNLHDKIWSRIFTRPRVNYSTNLSVLWNILYAWGYYPNIKFVPTHWVNEEPIAEMEARMKSWFFGHQGLPANYELIIRDVLEEIAVNGLVREEVETTIGMIVWQI